MRWLAKYFDLCVVEPSVWFLFGIQPGWMLKRQVKERVAYRASVKRANKGEHRTGANTLLDTGVLRALQEKEAAADKVAQGNFADNVRRSLEGFGAREGRGDGFFSPPRETHTRRIVFSDNRRHVEAARANTPAGGVKLLERPVEVEMAAVGRAAVDSPTAALRVLKQEIIHPCFKCGEESSNALLDLCQKHADAANEERVQAENLQVVIDDHPVEIVVELTVDEYQRQLDAELRALRG